MDERALKKVVLDSGHGGTDSGTVANGIVEKDYNLKISDYIHKRLDEMGVPNKMTRTSDVTLTPSERPKKVQSFYGNGSDVIVVSNHINAGGGDGAEVIYALRNNDTFAKKIAKEFENAGQNVRKYYQRRLPSNPAKDYYYIMRDTPNNETVIVEYGFADSDGDDVSQLKNNWENLAEAVTKAIVEYAGGKYVAPLDSNYYTVKSGDSLWSISRKFGVSVSELKEANNLSSNLLSIGQNLIIPGKVPEKESDEYVVQKGDTLYSIARKFNTTVDNLKSLNNITTDSLAIGQILKIPGEESITGNTYNVEMEVQHLDENPGKKTTQANYTKIGENVYYSEYTTQVLEQLESSTTGEISLKEGDRIVVNVKNTNTTQAQTLKGSLLSFTNAGQYTIAASSTGMIKVNGK